MAIWHPQPGPQQYLIGCPIEDVFFGGSRGGGKTDGLLGDWLNFALEYGAAAKGVIFRKTYPELEEIERRAAEIYSQMGARWLGTKRTWEWSNGAFLKLRYLERENDADRYQGHSYSYIGWDEITNWSTAAGVDKLRACLRSSVAGVPKLWRVTGNPGGPGHNWVKAQYIDPSPALVPFEDRETGIWRVYIPSRLEDNPSLCQNDPQYWRRVEQAASGRADLIKAWRYGLWDIVAGGMFDDVWRREIHEIAPFKIPHSWTIDRAFDWGSSKPFTVQWWAESDGTTAPNGRTYPAKSVFLINEWYGWTGKPNEGLKLTAREIARGIKQREAGMVGSLWEQGHQVKPGPADTSIFDAENGVCIADDMKHEGVRWERADKSPGSVKIGCDRLRAMLKASMQTPMEDPGMFIFDNCRDGWLRTVPVLSRDKNKPDVYDTASEDHSADAGRYRIMRVRHYLKAVPIVGV